MALDMSPAELPTAHHLGLQAAIARPIGSDRGGDPHALSLGQPQETMWS